MPSFSSSRSDFATGAGLLASAGGGVGSIVTAVADRDGGAARTAVEIDEPSGGVGGEVRVRGGCGAREHLRRQVLRA